MKILFISRLYPTNLEHYSFEKVSDILHKFVREWIKTDDARVVRPLVMNLNPLKPFKYDTKKILPGETNLEGVPLYKVRAIRLPLFERYWCGKISRFLKNKDFFPDVVVAHMNESIFIGRKIARKHGVPLIAGIHMSDIEFFKYPLAGKRLMRTLRCAGGIACRSIPIRDRLLSVMPELSDKCFIAHSGIEKELISASETAAKKVREWKNGRRVEFVTVSYFEKRKMIDVNIRALARLPRAVDWHYTIVGVGDEGDALRGLVKSNGLEQRITFTGLLPRRKALEVMEKTDIFIMVADRETFGIAYLEAMAKGNIVIASRNWGVDGIILHGINGFLCTAGDEEELHTLLGSIVLKTGENQLANIATSSMNTVNNYTHEQASLNYLEHIYRLQAEHGRRS